MSTSLTLQEQHHMLYQASRHELLVPWSTRKRRLEQLQALLKTLNVSFNISTCLHVGSSFICNVNFIQQIY